MQRAKKVVSDSPCGLVDFVIGLVNFVLYLPNWQEKFFEEFKLQKCEINCAHQKVSGASWNDIWVSKCQFQLAQMASCKTNSLGTLILVMFLDANPSIQVTSFAGSFWGQNDRISLYRKKLQWKTECCCKLGH